MFLSGRLGLGLLLVSVMLSLTAGPLRAQEAYLVTYGPGQEVWELFGHNSIWIHDPDQGIDHTFSFGYFDLDRPGFYADFARGIMPYYGSAAHVDREFAFYRERDRDIRIQRLNLNRDEVVRLFNRLHQSIFPQPQYYDYDYYLANCSTRLRDLLDEITDGALSSHLRDLPANRNFRDHTRALTAHRFFIYTGIQTLLGPMIDQPISVWDEAFLPQRLADALTDVELARGPLVLDDRIEFESSSVTGRFDAPAVWPIHLILGLVCAGLLLLPRALGARIRPTRFERVVTRIGAGVVALAGLVIVLMWVASGHEATWRSAMVLVLNPLWILWLLPLRRRWRAPLWWLLLVLAVPGSIYLLLPSGQFRPDILLWYLPLIAALFWTSYGAWVGSESAARSKSI